RGQLQAEGLLRVLEGKLVDARGGVGELTRRGGELLVVLVVHGNLLGGQVPARMAGLCDAAYESLCCDATSGRRTAGVRSVRNGINILPTLGLAVAQAGAACASRRSDSPKCRF